MINLIPNKEKKEMVKGFYYKLVILFLVMSSISVFIFFVAILPSYFLSSARNNLIHSRLEIQKGEPVPLPDQETLLAIQNLDNKLNLIEKTRSDKYVVSERVINTIILKKVPDIKITDITYENNPSEGLEGGKPEKKIMIRGIAPSREVLLLFRHALEDGTAFRRVDLPISNFVKGSDIQFNLSLIPN